MYFLLIIIIGLGVALSVICSSCGKENRIKAYESHRTGSRGPEAVDLNTKAALAMLHTGQGHTHLNASLSILGIGAISEETCKKREREVGNAVETVCKASCVKEMEEEKSRSNKVDSEGHSLIAVAYDGAWQKRGKARDSTTGFGTIIGEKTGKVIDYRVKSTRCKQCEAAEPGTKPKPHDCRKNFSGSSKSMEPEIAVDCFNDAQNHGLKYAEYIGDEDATTESHVRYRVDYETSKRTDKNHATRTLGSRLYNAQKNVKGLTSSVIQYIIKLFAYCVSQNQGKAENISKGMTTIVKHAFGDHAQCDSNWCGALKDPSSYKHRDLPGGKPLSDSNLRAAIEDAISPFMSTEWCSKLANCGSTQANECVNGIVATKAPKTRHYGSSESICYRVSSGIAQYNEGPEYLVQTTKELGIPQEKITEGFVNRASRKRKREQDRKKSLKVKKRRREIKKEKTRKKERLERREGRTYESGIGVTPEGKEMTKGMIEGMIEDVTDEELANITSGISHLETESSSIKDDGVYECFSFDIETTGLKRDSEIIQIACTNIRDEHQNFNVYAVPEGNVAPSASKVNQLTTSFQDGKKVLMKNNRSVAKDVTSEQALTKFIEFLDRQRTTGEGKIILIAHNGDSFDFPVFVNSLTKYALLERSKELGLLFLDSLRIFRRINCSAGNKVSLSLSSIYERTFKDGFDAHDAYCDCQALAKILCSDQVKFSVTNHLDLVHSVVGMEISLKASAGVRSRMVSLSSLPASKSMKKKISEAGIDRNKLQDVFANYGAKGLTALLATPVSKPRVTKNSKVLGKIVNFFVNKSK